MEVLDGPFKKDCGPQFAHDYYRKVILIKIA